MLAGALVALSAARAEAVLLVYACNDIGCVGGDAFVADNGAGDTNAMTGIVSTSFFGGSVDLTATTKPTVGTELSPYLNLTYSITAAGFQSLSNTPYLYAIETGFSGVGTLNFSADASNPTANGGTGSLLGATGAFAFPGTVLFTCMMDCSGTAAAPTAPYYLAVRVQPNVGVSGAASGDATAYLTAATVPDGGSTAALLGSVLVGFGLLRRKLSNI